MRDLFVFWQDRNCHANLRAALSHAIFQTLERKTHAASYWANTISQIYLPIPRVPSAWCIIFLFVFFVSFFNPPWSWSSSNQRVYSAWFTPAAIAFSSLFDLWKWCGNTKSSEWNEGRFILLACEMIFTECTTQRCKVTISRTRGGYGCQSRLIISPL